MPAIPGLRIMHVRRWALPVPLVLGLSLASGVPGAAHAQETPPTLSLDSLLAIPISAAARYDQATGEAAASITLVTRDDIEAYGFRSLWEILQTLGGFYATSDRVYNYVGVRGFGRPSDTNNRILLLVDGRPWNDITNYEADVSLGLGIPPEHMERIEVVRGPGSALYGGAAMLTVVNVITRSPRDGGGVVGASVGSFGMRRLGLSWAGELPGGVGATVWGAGVDNPGPDLFFPELADQGLGDGRVVGRDGLRAVTGGGTLRAGSFELLLMASDLKKGDPTAPYGASPSETSERNAAGWAGDLRFRRRLGARAEAFSAIRVDAGRLEATYGFAPPAPDHLAEVRGTRITGDLQLRLDASPSSRLVVGAEIRRVRPRMRIGADFGAGPVFPPEIRPSLDMASLFVQHEWQARTDLSVVLGARADRADIGGSALSPRAAVVWHPAPTTALKALYGKAFRAPTPLEQFVDVPGVIVANPDLAPERIRTLELVWEQRLGRHLHGTFSAYDFRMTDLIVQGFDSGVRDLTYQNLGRVHGRGVGAELTGRLGGGRSVFANALLQEAVDQASGESLANSPSLLWRAGAESPLVGGVRLGVVGLYDARRRTLMGATTSANARVNVHLTRALGGPLRASMSVFNLFDARYDHPGGLEHRQQFMPQDGRTLQVQLHARF